ncbi:hypothetical protein I312_105575 [Cryptococcus bacillisporus CA1280]|uniref:uncharacterized protein n=1 Tax=Cryptococcus bacillisporus CA1280 TaxID=1296109 RepID=UPI00336720FF
MLAVIMIICMTSCDTSTHIDYPNPLDGLPQKEDMSHLLSFLATPGNTLVEDQDVMDMFHCITDTFAEEKVSSQISEIFIHGKSQYSGYGKNDFSSKQIEDMFTEPTQIGIFRTLNLPLSARYEVDMVDPNWR